MLYFRKKCFVYEVLFYDESIVSSIGLYSSLKAAMRAIKTHFLYTMCKDNFKINKRIVYKTTKLDNFNI